MNLVQLDLFGLSAVVKKVIEKITYETRYFVELIDGIYHCFVQRRKGKAKWSKKSVIEKSKKQIFLAYADSDMGLKIKI